MVRVVSLESCLALSCLGVVFHELKKEALRVYQSWKLVLGVDGLLIWNEELIYLGPAHSRRSPASRIHGHFERRSWRGAAAASAIPTAALV